MRLVQLNVEGENSHTQKKKQLFGDNTAVKMKMRLNALSPGA